MSDDASKQTSLPTPNNRSLRWRKLRALLETNSTASNRLGDFTATPRLLPISLIAIFIGIVSAFLAQGLLKFIALFTNLFFYQRFSTSAVSPAAHHLGAWVIVVPVIGGLIVGLMARYGSERIRGHRHP